MEAGTNPSLLFDDSWLLSIAHRLAAMSVVARDLREITYVPASVYHIHFDVEILANQIDSYVARAATGIDTLDYDLMAVSIDLTVDMANRGTAIGDKIGGFCQ